MNGCVATRACNRQDERDSKPDGVKSTTNRGDGKHPIKHTWDVCTTLTAPHGILTPLDYLYKLKSSKKNAVQSCNANFFFLFERLSFALSPSVPSYKSKNLSRKIIFDR